MLYEAIKTKEPLYLAGDIGGTKTLLGLYTHSGSVLTLVTELMLPSKDWHDLNSLIRDFLKAHALDPEDITGGCLSLAGPIRQEECLLTNLNRRIDFPSFSTMNFQNQLHFVNDLEAMGHGLIILDKKDLLCLNPAVFKNPSVCDEVLKQNRALIAPGTGLGEAMVLAGNRVYATEAAHADFAPRTEQEVGLWRFLAHKYGHVSYERVLSGPGLENIYEFLYKVANHQRQPQLHKPPLNLTLSHTTSFPLSTAAEITKKALAGICPLCTEALELFIQVLGAEAGNLALRTLAYGGVYLAGGIPAKILPKLQEETFLEAFLAKGRLRDLLAQIPVYVVLNERIGLLGAAHIAHSLSK